MTKEKDVFTLFQRITCKHLFRGIDMQTRNEEGIVKWQCYKCNKVFAAENGLDILKNGTCDGLWDFLITKIEMKPVINAGWYSRGYDSISRDEFLNRLAESNERLNTLTGLKLSEAQERALKRNQQIINNLTQNKNE